MASALRRLRQAIALACALLAGGLSLTTCQVRHLTSPEPATVAVAPAATRAPVGTPSALPVATKVPAAPAPLLTLSSTAFAGGGSVPEQYTCFGDNMSPPLAWSGLPSGTQSLALIVYDPDSKPPGFIHWVVYDISPASSGLAAGLPPQAALPDGIAQGKNTFAEFDAGTFPGGKPINQVGYDGPCPPARHRYVFTLYALDAPPAVAPGASATELSASIEAHILAQAELMGVYAPPQ